MCGAAACGLVKDSPAPDASGRDAAGTSDGGAPVVASDATPDAATDAGRGFVDAGRDAAGDGPAADADARADIPPPCLPEPEVCNGTDDDCDDETDEGLDCAPCASACPFSELRSDLRLCAAWPGIDTACGGDYPEDKGVLHTAPAEPEVSCTPCACSASLRPVQWDRADPDCRVGFPRDSIDCAPPGCEADLCADQTFGHQADVNLHAEGGLPGAVCRVPEGHSYRLCCRAGLPASPQCPDAVCPVPDGSLGPVVWGEGSRAGWLCGNAGLPEVQAYAEAVPTGLACAPCPCEAQATVAACDGPEALSCTATAARPACSTDCLVRFRPENGEAVNTGVRLSLTVAGDGAIPAPAGGACEPRDTRTLCDGSGAL